MLLCPLTPDCPPRQCSFDRTYRYGLDGGFVAYRDEVTLAPAARYLYTRRSAGGGAAAWTCAPPPPPCNTPSIVDVADVMGYLTGPGLAPSFADPVPPLYGVDPRPVDGSVFRLTRDDGRGFVVGSPCHGATSCAEIPGPVAGLVEKLRSLDRQQLAQESCATLR